MIRRIINYRKKAKLTLDLFVLKSDYLQSGKYCLDTELKYLYRSDSKTINFVKEVVIKNNYNLGNKEGFKNKIKHALAPNKVRLIEKPSKQLFLGSIYLLSNDITDEKDVKIFDINNNKILTVYVGLYALKKKIKAYVYFNKYFDIPKIIDYNYNKKISVEELILSKPKNSWSKLDYEIVIGKIFTNYKLYYESFSSIKHCTSMIFSDIISKLKTDKVLGELVYEIENEISSSIILNEVPRIHQHGDLWLYNTILSANNRVYFIDWEHSEELIFFFDLFFWMKNEALDNSDFSYLMKYLNGSYDHHFKEIYVALKYKFDENLKKDYFYIFMIELIYKKIYGKPESLKKSAIIMYTRLFTQVKEANALIR